MNEVKPWGDPRKTEILVIGHDPRLRKSDTEAKYAFFFDYLEREKPSESSELAKYNFAKALIDYISYLTKGKYCIDNKNKLEVTNLCNVFLNPPVEGGIVLISNDNADHGIVEIEALLIQGSFKLILPMSQQTFYHLARTGFVTGNGITNFINQSKPDKQYQAYVPVKQRAFVPICGEIFYHGRIPVVPVLHIKNAQRWLDREPYSSRLKIASDNISNILNE